MPTSYDATAVFELDVFEVLDVPTEGAEDGLVGIALKGGDQPCDQVRLDDPINPLGG